MTYEEHADVIWDEVEEPTPVMVAPVMRHHITPAEDRGAGYTPCRCWRCRGTVSAHEREVLDRALARHLLRMGYQERGDWLGSWALNLKHTAADAAILRRWIAIEAGQNLPHPVYPGGSHD